MKIYQISGLGANEKAFKYLQLNPDFEMVYLPWLLPEKNENLQHYSERMLEKVNLNEDFLLMGLSFGGIIVKEMNSLVEPKFNFLISTIKDRTEMPAYMRFSSQTNLHKIIPSAFLTSDGLLSYSIARKLYNTRAVDLKEVFEFRNHHYLKWSMHQIVNWKNNTSLNNFMHFHGDKDIIFPYSKLHNAIKIEGGTHIMIMQKAKKISELINHQLEIL